MAPKTIKSTKTNVKSTTGKKSTDKMSIEEMYKQKSDVTHVLDLPDTYIGGIEEDDNKLWVFNEETLKIVYKNIKYIPGLYKIYDEIIVNASDHTVRDKTCKTIRININKETGEISCMNDGVDGIDVAIHKELGIYVPEMIFGHLRTSRNYD